MRYALLLLIVLTLFMSIAAAAAPTPASSLLPPSYVYVRYQKPTPESPYTIVEVVAVVLGDEGAEVRFIGDLNIYDGNGDLIHGECLNSALVRGGETVVARYAVPPKHSGNGLWWRSRARSVRASACMGLGTRAPPAARLSHRYLVSV